MSLGRVVISTTMGLEGIPAKEGKQVLIADTVEAFVGALKFCCDRQNEMEQIGIQAKNFIKTEFNSDQLARKLLRAYQMTLSENHHE